jgi:hypothetical protein
MAETLSTLDVPLQWIERKRDLQEQVGTRFFLFSHQSGHLPEAGHVVVREREVAASEGAISATLAQGPFDKVNASSRDHWLPRARRLSPPPTDRYILLKKYEGVVISRTQDSFTARLVENQSDYPVLEAEFDIDELSEGDRKLAVEGAALVWTIGYRYEGSTRKRESAIYLRRLPPWTEKEIEAARRTAEQLTHGIRWE